MNDDFSRLAPSFLPATAALELTYDCNHSCLFCSCPWEAPVPKITRGKELTVDEWKSAITTLTDMGVCNIAFTGGEPLLKDGWEEIIAHTAQCKAELIETVEDKLVSTMTTPKIYLISNGTLVDDHVLKICKKYNVHLSMSLPGLTTYTAHTKCGSPDHVLAQFRKTATMGITTTVNVTVTQKNFFELYETIAEALIAGADTLLMNRFLPGGRGLRHKDDLLLTSDQIREALLIADRVLAEANRQGHLGTEVPLCLVHDLDIKKLKVGVTCSAAKDFFVIGPSGYIRTCNHSEVELVSVTDIETCKDHPYWKRFVMKDYSPAFCRECGARFSCDAGCREAAHIMEGDLRGDDYTLTSCKPL